MSNLYNDRYDEMKNLLKRSKLMLEQSNPEARPNVALDIEKKIEQDTQEYETADGGEEETTPEDKVQKYRISGGILALHGKDKGDLDITSDDKIAFQETMDEFVEEVSDLVDSDVLNVYENNVEWSGKIIDEDLEFILRIGEDSGIYINAQMVKVDQEFLDLINKLQQYYQKFKSKWSRILASRKKTRETNA
jgi:hypothetical protein